MRLVLLAGVFVVGIGLQSASASGAAVMTGSALKSFERVEWLATPVHCQRFLPHGHAAGKPHTFGFGCHLKRTKPKRPIVRTEPRKV